MANLTRIAAPAVTPLSLAEAKAHLRVSSSDTDDIITIYLKAATDYVDGEWGFLGRALITQTWRLTLDQFPGANQSWTYPTFGGGAWSSWGFYPSQSSQTSGQIKIPLPPLQSVTAIAYDDPAGNEQTVNLGEYFVDNASEPGWIVPINGQSWPATLSGINTVRIDFIAGYSPDASSPPDLTANVPFNIKAGLLLLLSSMFEYREENVEKAMARIPFGADILLRRHKIDKSMA